MLITIKRPTANRPTANIHPLCLVFCFILGGCEEKMTYYIKETGHRTLLVTVKDQSYHFVYLNIMHKITNLYKFELNRSSKLRDNNERKKHPCHTKLCAFRCLISRPQVLNLRSQKSNSWKVTSFSKTRSLQRELFLTMFYTINLSSLLVTK